MTDHAHPVTAREPADTRLPGDFGTISPVVVTGVAGFIGHHTAHLLLDQGVEVIGIDSLTPYYDRETKRRNLEGLTTRDRFSWLEADVLSGTLDDALAGAGSVLHLAAQPGVRDSWDQFDTYVDLNVRATKHLLDRAIEHRVGRVVAASSSSVYGSAPEYPTHEVDPVSPRSPYGITKLAAERLAVAYATERHLPTVSLRYFTVYGPAQRPDMAIERLLRAARAGDEFPLFGDGGQVRDFTFVGDVARANALALVGDVPPGEVFNVCSEQPHSLDDVIRTVEQVTGERVHLDRQEAALGDVRRTGGSAARIRELLGWEPRVDLHEGIAAQDRELIERRDLLGSDA